MLNPPGRITEYASQPCIRLAEPPPTDQIHITFSKDLPPLIASLVMALMNLTWARATKEYLGL